MYFWTFLALLNMASVRAMPLLAPRDDVALPEQSVSVAPSGEPDRDRTIYLMISLVSMGLLCFLLGFRATKFKRSVFMKRSVMSSLVLIIFIQIIAFITVTSVLITGQGLRNYSLCRGVSWACLVGYSFTKFMICVFLIERVHIVQAPFVTRRKDKIYLGCLAMLLIAFTPLCIKFYNPMTKLDPVTGRCRAGNRREAIIPTIAVMSVVDIILTAVFFYLLRPIGQVHSKPSVTQILSGRRDNSTTPGEAQVQETSAQRNIRLLLWKSIIGSILIELPAIANFVQMAITRGEELGMICLSVCVIEVVWDALVIYWLTFGSSAKAEKELNQTTYVSMPSTAASRKDSIESGKHGDVIALQENHPK